MLHMWMGFQRNFLLEMIIPLGFFFLSAKKLFFFYLHLCLCMREEGSVPIQFFSEGNNL